MRKLLAVLFGAVLVLGACGGGDSNDNGNNNNNGNNGNNSNNNASENVGAGEELYQNNCAGCHGGDLGGISGPNLQKIGGELSAEEIADIIENGKGGMPSVTMPDDDREELSEWLANKK